MKIGLGFRNEIGSIKGGQWIIDQFDQLIARISGVWRVEHADNGQHTNINAVSVTTEDLTVNDQFSAVGLRAQSFVRIGSVNPSLPGMVIKQSAGHAVFYENDGTTKTTVEAAAADFTARVTAVTLTLSGLPTADPMVSGQVWNDGGTLKIST